MNSVFPLSFAPGEGEAGLPSSVFNYPPGGQQSMGMYSTSRTNTEAGVTLMTVGPSSSDYASSLLSTGMGTQTASVLQPHPPPVVGGYGPFDAHSDAAAMCGLTSVAPMTSSPCFGGTSLAAGSGTGEGLKTINEERTEISTAGPVLQVPSLKHVANNHVLPHSLPSSSASSARSPVPPTSFELQSSSQKFALVGRNTPNAYVGGTPVHFPFSAEITTTTTTTTNNNNNNSNQSRKKSTLNHMTPLASGNGIISSQRSDDSMPVMSNVGCFSSAQASKYLGTQIHPSSSNSSPPHYHCNNYNGANANPDSKVLVFDTDFRDLLTVPLSAVRQFPPPKKNITRWVICRNHVEGSTGGGGIGNADPSEVVGKGDPVSDGNTVTPDGPLVQRTQSLGSVHNKNDANANTNNNNNTNNANRMVTETEETPGRAIADTESANLNVVTVSTSSGGCSMGPRCNFVHVEMETYGKWITRHPVHINYAWAKPEDCTYPRLEPGKKFLVRERVFNNNGSATGGKGSEDTRFSSQPLEVDSDCIIRTAAFATKEKGDEEGSTHETVKVGSEKTPHGSLTPCESSFPKPNAPNPQARKQRKRLLGCEDPKTIVLLSSTCYMSSSDDDDDDDDGAENGSGPEDDARSNGVEATPKTFLRQCKYFHGHSFCPYAEECTDVHILHIDPTKRSEDHKWVRPKVKHSKRNANSTSVLIPPTSGAPSMASFSNVFDSTSLTTDASLAPQRNEATGRIPMRDGGDTMVPAMYHSHAPGFQVNNTNNHMFAPMPGHHPHPHSSLHHIPMHPTHPCELNHGSHYMDAVSPPPASSPSFPHVPSPQSFSIPGGMRRELGDSAAPQGADGGNLFRVDSAGNTGPASSNSSFGSGHHHPQLPVHGGIASTPSHLENLYNMYLDFFIHHGLPTVNVGGPSLPESREEFADMTARQMLNYFPSSQQNGGVGVTTTDGELDSPFSPDAADGRLQTGFEYPTDLGVENHPPHMDNGSLKDEDDDLLHMMTMLSSRDREFDLTFDAEARLGEPF